MTTSEDKETELQKSSKTQELRRSLGTIGVMITVFLVRYRAKKAQVSWKVTLLETVVIIAIATIVSLIIGSGL